MYVFKSGLVVLNALDFGRKITISEFRQVAKELGFRHPQTGELDGFRRRLKLFAGYPVVTIAWFGAVDFFQKECSWKENELLPGLTHFIAVKD